MRDRPSWNDGTRAAGDASRRAVLVRRRNAIGPQMMARIAVPAALAWRDDRVGAPALRDGSAPRSARVLGHRPRIVHPVRAAGRGPAPAWFGAAPERAAEAIVLRAAGEGWRVGASCPVPEWRDGWAGYAEMGAVAWAAIDDPDRRIDSETWIAMEATLREGALAAHGAHPGLEAMSALVRKMLEQTDRNHVACAPDDRTLCAAGDPCPTVARARRGGTLSGAAGATGTDRSVVARRDRAPGRRRAERDRVLGRGRGVQRARRLPRRRGRQGGVVPHGGHLARRGRRRAHASGCRRARIPRCASTIRKAPRARRRGGGRHRHALRARHRPDRTRADRDRAAPRTRWSAGPARGPTARAPGRQARRGTAPPRRNVRSPRSSRSSARPSPSGAKSAGRARACVGAAEGGPLLARQEVGPHWKRQAYGPRYSRRKWIVGRTLRAGARAARRPDRRDAARGATAASRRRLRKRAPEPAAGPAPPPALRPGAPQPLALGHCTRTRRSPRRRVAPLPTERGALPHLAVRRAGGGGSEAHGVLLNSIRTRGDSTATNAR